MSAFSRPAPMSFLINSQYGMHVDKGCLCMRREGGSGSPVVDTAAGSIAGDNRPEDLSADTTRGITYTEIHMTYY